MNKRMQKKLEVFQKAYGKEIYGRYNVATAHFFAQEDGDFEMISVDTLAESCGFNYRPVEEYTEVDGREYCIFATPDGSRRVIDLQHTQTELDMSKVVIMYQGNILDGHHRVYRAFMLGLVESLPVYELTAEEAVAC